MRPYFEIPLYLLPTFLFTSEILFVSTSATVIPGDSQINRKKSRSPEDKFNLTTCAKQCRNEFFQYCHTRDPASKGDTNSFRTCMCVYKSSAQYMDHCARHCNNEGSSAEQVGELRAWWTDWCEPTGSKVELEKGKGPGISLLGTDGGTEKDSLTPTPSSIPETTTKDGEQKGHGVGVFAAGASVTFASAFLFLSYIMFMRRSKYARRRGILAWLRLRLTERGYRGSGARLPRSRTTAMRIRVTNGRTAVVGNPKWLNKTMPPLPQQQSTNTPRTRDLRDIGDSNDAGFLSRIMGRQGSGQRSPGGLSRGGVGMLGWNQGRRKSHRYSQGWLNAAKEYTDIAEEEDEKVQDYFRSKGIARSGRYPGTSPTANGHNALPGDASGANGTLMDGKEVEQKRYGDGGLDIGEEDDDTEMAEVAPPRQQLQAVNEGEDYIKGRVGSTSRNTHPYGKLKDINEEDYDEDEDCNEQAGQRSSQINPFSGGDSADRSRSSSPEGDYAINAYISATPHLDGGEWDSWSGVEGTQINATGGLRRASRIPGRSYGNGGLNFEEVDLVEAEDDGYGWAAMSDTHTLQFPSYSVVDTNTTQSSTGYDPILPVIEPDSQKGKGTMEKPNQRQHKKTGSKWNLSGKVPKAFLGRKGKRSGGSGSTDLGRGAYGSL